MNYKIIVNEQPMRIYLWFAGRWFLQCIVYSLGERTVKILFNPWPLSKVGYDWSGRKKQNLISFWEMRLCSLHSNSTSAKGSKIYRDPLCIRSGSGRRVTVRREFFGLILEQRQIGCKKKFSHAKAQRTPGAYLFGDLFILTLNSTLLMMVKPKFDFSLVFTLMRGSK